MRAAQELRKIDGLRQDAAQAIRLITRSALTYVSRKLVASIANVGAGLQFVRESVRGPVARVLLATSRMGEKIESWTIPLHVIMWTTITVGLIMVMVVVLMH